MSALCWAGWAVVGRIGNTRSRDLDQKIEPVKVDPFHLSMDQVAVTKRLVVLFVFFFLLFLQDVWFDSLQSINRPAAIESNMWIASINPVAQWQAMLILLDLRGHELYTDLIDRRAIRSIDSIRSVRT